MASKFVTFSFAVTICLFNLSLLVDSNALDDYVNQYDPHTSYTLLDKYRFDNYTIYILNFTSQKWLDESVSNRVIWWHYLSISIPDKITRPDTAFLLIDGGSNRPSPPAQDSTGLQEIGFVSVSTGAVCADLGQVPNQPLVFKDDPSQKQRVEDDIIAWTWMKFLKNTSFPYILLRMPMTKAAVRAMDAVQNFTRDTASINIKSFMVAGASKRGWTTWTTAAVDKRVVAAVPMVMDLLHINTNMHHHFRSLGGWTFAFKSYHELNITANLDSPGINALESLVDPASYLDRYRNINFLVLNCAGDEFFLPDDSDYYWDEFLNATQGTALKRLVPNADHYMKGHLFSILLTIRSFFMSVHDKVPLPKFTWTRTYNSTHGSIRVTVDIKNGPKPSDVTVYFAETTNSSRRDFRLFVGPDPSKPQFNPSIWVSIKKIVKIVSQTNEQIVYEAAMEKPSSGWVAFYFQLAFPGLESSVVELTSEISIVPNTFPFADCYKESCLGTLV